VALIILRAVNLAMRLRDSRRTVMNNAGEDIAARALTHSYPFISSVDPLSTISYMRIAARLYTSHDNPILNPLVALAPTIWVHQNKRSFHAPKKMTDIALSRTLTVAEQCIAVIVLAIMGIISSGCGDSASISEGPQVRLADLTINPGSLQPAFSSDTVNYVANVPTAVGTVTVTATPQDSTSSVTIAGTATQSLQVTLEAPPSSKAIIILLTSQSGSQSTYTITVNRAALAGNNDLAALTVTSGTLVPGFTPSTSAYTVDVVTDVTSVTVAATKSDPDAVMHLHSVTVPAGTASGQDTIPLNGPGTDTSVLITMTAPNGSSKTYSLTIHRAASSNNKLSRLTVSVGSLTPSFAPTTLNYTVNVNGFTPSMTISATKQDPNAVMSASGSVIAPSGVPTGQVTVPLQGASIDVPITVIAQDGSPQIYRITVNRSF
jgi:hypothetical protein